MGQLAKKGERIKPVTLQGRTISRSFWGKAWCAHLESFSDYSNRLPRGRTYVRNGSVVHLDIQPGRVEARVAGSSLYRVTIAIEPLARDTWAAIEARCTGQIGSILELLQGRLSGQIMAVVTDRRGGLFPDPRQISLQCSCPDWAVMCKHVAAALYGVASRLDEQPELLFTLRGVDPQQLVAAELALPVASEVGGNGLADDQLADIFGIDLDDEPEPAAPSPERAPPTFHPSGPAIADLRRTLDLSVTAFAARLGVTSATVRRWEAAPSSLVLRDRPRRALQALVDQVSRG